MDKEHTAAASTSTNIFDIHPSVVSGRNENFGGGSDESVNVDSYTPHFCGESVPLTVAEVECLTNVVVVESRGTRWRVRGWTLKGTSE